MTSQPLSSLTGGARATQTRSSSSSSTITAGKLARIGWQRRQQLVLCIAGGALVGLALSIVLPKKYVSQASFVGTSTASMRLPRSLSALAGLAGDLGALSGIESGPLSPRFYGSLLRSNAILSALATAPLPDSNTAGAPARPLATILAVGGRSAADTIDRAVRRLKRLIVVDVDSRTGVVSFTLTARRAYLASAAAESLLARVNNFLTNNFRIQASEQRRFLQDRLSAIEAEVRDKQEALRSFYESNRDYRNSPTLVFREAVLRRELEIKQDIYLSVARSLEEARINEVKDTPLLTVIDRPVPPPRPRQPKPLLNAVLLAMFAPVLWLAVILLRLRDGDSL